MKAVTPDRRSKDILQALRKREQVFKASGKGYRWWGDTVTKAAEEYAGVLASSIEVRYCEVHKKVLRMAEDVCYEGGEVCRVTYRLLIESTRKG